MKKSTEKLLNWDAHYVGISSLVKRQQNCITLDELCQEVLPLLSPFAPITIEDQIPVFTEWAANALKESTQLQKNNYWYKPKFY
jgi:hypothetical protein